MREHSERKKPALLQTGTGFDVSKDDFNEHDDQQQAQGSGNRPADQPNRAEPLAAALADRDARGVRRLGKGIRVLCLEPIGPQRLDAYSQANEGDANNGARGAAIPSLM